MLVGQGLDPGAGPGEGHGLDSVGHEIGQQVCRLGRGRPAALAVAPGPRLPQPEGHRLPGGTIVGDRGDRHTDEA